MSIFLRFGSFTENVDEIEPSSDRFHFTVQLQGYVILQLRDRDRLELGQTYHTISPF